MILWELRHDDLGACVSIDFNGARHESYRSRFVMIPHVVHQRVAPETVGLPLRPVEVMIETDKVLVDLSTSGGVTRGEHEAPSLGRAVVEAFMRMRSLPVREEIR